MNKLMIIFSASSCSGKSFYSNILKDTYNAKIFSSDETAEKYFGLINQRNTQEVFDFMYILIEKECKNNIPIVVVDATNTRNLFANKYREFAKEYGYKTLCIQIKLNEEDLHNNIIERINGRWNDKSYEEVEKLVKKQLKILQKPSGYDKVLYINRKLNKEEFLEIFERILKEFAVK